MCCWGFWIHQVCVCILGRVRYILQMVEIFLSFPKVTLQRSVSSPACCAVLSYHHPNSLSPSSSAGNASQPVNHWSLGLAPSGNARYWQPGRTPDTGTWWMLNQLWNYDSLMSSLQGSGTLPCPCSASSQGGGPAGGNGGTHLARGLACWRRVCGRVCPLSLRAGITQMPEPERCLWSAGAKVCTIFMQAFFCLFPVIIQMPLPSLPPKNSHHVQNLTCAS